MGVRVQTGRVKKNLSIFFWKFVFFFVFTEYKIKSIVKPAESTQELFYQGKLNLSTNNIREITEEDLNLRPQEIMDLMKW